MIVRIMVVLSLLVLSGCIKSYKPDNFVEQLVEKVIEDKTGIEIDFTPSSVERVTLK